MYELPARCLHVKLITTSAYAKYGHYHTNHNCCMNKTIFELSSSSKTLYAAIPAGSFLRHAVGVPSLGEYNDIYGYDPL